eukprot:6505982-Pyramimonas_sp.AAC.1
MAVLAVIMFIALVSDRLLTPCPRACSLSASSFRKSTTFASQHSTMYCVTRSRVTPCSRSRTCRGHPTWRRTVGRAYGA